MERCISSTTSSTPVRTVPFAQLTIYALALARLAGLQLFDIKCAWFNENQYCEFFPRTVLARAEGKHRVQMRA